MRYKVLKQSRTENTKPQYTSGDNDSFCCPECNSDVRIIREPIGASFITCTCTCPNCKSKYSILA